MRIFVTGGSGVLGRGLVPLLRSDGHEVIAPGSRELDLFDVQAVDVAMRGVEAVYHLATRIPTGERASAPDAWDENNRLRRDGTPILVDAALKHGAATFVLPSITFMYPAEGSADEDTPFGPAAGRLSSMIDAENAVRRFAEAGHRGVILRLGLLWGPGTGNDAPAGRYGSTLQIDDAASALRLGLNVPSGVYNVTDDGQRIANGRFKTASGWRPRPLP
jgi:nucleoside-diphosphate-sugar epimerase